MDFNRNHRGIRRRSLLRRFQGQANKPKTDGAVKARANKTGADKTVETQGGKLKGGTNALKGRDIKAKVCQSRRPPPSPPPPAGLQQPRGGKSRTAGKPGG